MLPDLRIVIAAVVSTFVLTAGVGFYTSVRLMSEPNKHAESLAAREESPVSRIALSWPAPSRQPDQPALDFAVTAKALRNPVRDVTHEPDDTQQWPAPAQEPAAERVSEVALPAKQTDSPVAAERIVPAAPTVAAVEPPASEPVAAAQPEPQPEIKVAVQYPPILELPLELRTPVATPVAAAPEPAITSEPPQEASVTTGSIIEAPATPDAASPDAAAPAPKETEPQVANRPDSDAAVDHPTVTAPEPPKPAPKIARKKAAPKKAAPAKVAKRPVRRRPVATVPANTWLFNFFGTPVTSRAP